MVLLMVSSLSDISCTSGSGRMLQGMYTGLVLCPWAAQSVLWDTWCWERWLLGLTSFVFQRTAWLKAQVRQEDTAWNKNLHVSSLFFLPLPQMFHYCREYLCNLTTFDTYYCSGNWPQGQTAPNTCRHRAKPLNCLFTHLALLGMDPRGTLHTELPLWEECVSPFPGWGREN